jgi:hypothetical protein
VSARYAPAGLRRGIRVYCVLHEDAACFPHELDHIITEKHGGK